MVPTTTIPSGNSRAPLGRRPGFPGTARKPKSAWKVVAGFKLEAVPFSNTGCPSARVMGALYKFHVLMLLGPTNSGTATKETPATNVFPLLIVTEELNLSTPVITATPAVPEDKFAPKSLVP